uniref:N-alpha-acetyltransferase 25, NatB auxiliary subunit-like n=1 Tax=Monopterus albus TaxID=43700 RepID=UPI0009B3BAFB|nr:N-alpha-acetyltransferase 25, NatB auxiliary subunit-like [Monopterus albus]XP_020460612.1 N-alpha-acetyltransferase 25, NatB auxiliary subunit-like [Monopterus albus]XP_020460613.1 N-alpha-acetyltransferase 25, NatB auxiliary subunit-like [Monopterus albus]XP_020460614.1 N-alpha-acetyltransferase 25, NatB auxiliary subunit-like [Monopterus albus]
MVTFRVQFNIYVYWFRLTHYAESLRQFAAASQSCNFSLSFFHSNQKDTSEYIIQAYKYGVFEKIPEFFALRNGLNQSLHFAQVHTERMLLDLFVSSLEDSVKAMSLSAEEDDIPWNNMRDNRDPVCELEHESLTHLIY